MSDYRSANQVRLKLKMKISQYNWYHSSLVLPDDDGFLVKIFTNKFDSNIRKIVSPIIDGVNVKLEAI